MNGSDRPTAVRTTDYHTAGEPFRIVADAPRLTAATVAEKRLEAMRSPEVDGLRSLLCSEPRGHADMYGGFVVEPDDEGADLGAALDELFDDVAADGAGGTGNEDGHWDHSVLGWLVDIPKLVIH